MNWKIIFFLIVLGAFVYQDFKFRAIDWYWFLLLPSSIVFYMSVEPKQLIISFGINIGFLIMNSLLLVAYFSLKKGTLTNPLDKYIGLGDLFFYVGISVMFSPVNFLVFFTLSLLITLLSYSLLINLSLTKNKQIPLAGFVSILVLVFQIVNIRFGVDVSSDDWILERLSNGLY